MTTATTSDEIFYSVDSEGSHGYEIKKDSTAIFKGKAVATQAVPAIINMSQVADECLSVSMPLFESGITQHGDATGVFELYVDNVLSNSWFLRQDYSGEEWNGQDKCLSTPINCHADPRQILLYSQYSQSGNTISVGGGGYYFNVSPNTVSRDSSAQTVYFSVTTDSPQWVVNSMQSWITVNGITGSTVEIGIAANSGTTDRQGSISFNYLIDESGNTGSTSVSIAQSGASNNILYYTSTNNQVVTPNVTTGYGANIVSNTYSDGLGIITFDGIITSIPASGFSGCTMLQTIELPYTVTSLGTAAFLSASGLTQAKISDSITSIGEKVFQWCTSANTMTIGSGITDLNYRAFAAILACSSVTIPDTVTNMGRETFLDCKGLVEVTIGSGVTTIGTYCLGRCTALTTINFNGTKSQWNSITKGSNWNVSVPATVVHCTDGDVSI